MDHELKPNAGKQDIRVIDGKSFRRLPIKTHLITLKDNIVDVAMQYGAPVMEDPDDILFISEKCVACTQEGRAIPIKDIKPRPLATFLSKFVLKTPYGIGLGMPETMEMALRECGIPRILFAAAVSAVGKLFGIRGWFYNIAGYKARSIDGPCHNTIPPYNEYVVLSPLEPDKVARDVAAKLGYRVMVVDINDLEGQILGTSDDSIDRDLYVKVLKDNPLGQDDQQTPMGVIRHVKEA